MTMHHQTNTANTRAAGHYRLILPLSLSLITAGCNQLGLEQSAAAMQPLDSEVIHNTLLCGADIAEATVLRIDDSTALQQRYARFAEAGGDAVAPDIDFSRQRVLLIAMGPRSTSGFHLNRLMQQPLRYGGTTLEVPLAWHEPDADSVQASVMTSPCLLLAIEQLEFQRIRVIDQNGAVRIEGAPAVKREAGS
jgi:hypothetical protein